MDDLQFRRGVPAHAIRTDLDVEDANGKMKRRPRRVLVYGDLVVTTERALRARGAQLLIMKRQKRVTVPRSCHTFEMG